MSKAPLLSNTTLDLLPAHVERPNYDRSALRTGIVHFGVGAFHRSHQALAIDRLMNAGEAFDWAITGVGLMPADALLGERLLAQDCLYTLVEKHSNGHVETRVVGSIIDYKFAPKNPAAVIELLAQPSTKIVSMTITEGGYNFDSATLEFDSSNPLILDDLADMENPKTVFGYVTAGLKLRRDRGIEPFSIMSCDNIAGNGHIAHTMFTSFATLSDPELGGWIDTHVSFPNSMVDRITPVTTQADIRVVEELTGLADMCPVVGEPFFQWVLEDSFTLGRPDLDHVGVQIVCDVEPYELMKLRLLNASHQGIAYFGYLSGYRFVHDATNDPAMVAMLNLYMNNEATPTLSPVSGIDLDAYKAELISRFQNPEIKDTVLRLCAESSDRIPKWLVPVVFAQLAAGRSVDVSAAIIASWARYAEGTDEQGNPIEVVDQLKGELVPIAQSQQQDPLAFIRVTKLFGNLAEIPEFSEPYVRALNSLWINGAAETMAEISQFNHV